MAAGLSQIGEFSFILGQAGVKLKMLEGDQYSLILASAVLSITVNPLMFRLVGPLERALGRARRCADGAPGPARRGEAVPPGGEHVVVVGCGRVGGHIVDILGRIGVPRLVVESDSNRAEELQRQGVPVLFGDAANSEILTHAGLGHARALVVTIPDEAAGGLDGRGRPPASRRTCPSSPARPLPPG